MLRIAYFNTSFFLNLISTSGVSQSCGRFQRLRKGGNLVGFPRSSLKTKRNVNPFSGEKRGDRKETTPIKLRAFRCAQVKTRATFGLEMVRAFSGLFFALKKQLRRLFPSSVNVWGRENLAAWLPPPHGVGRRGRPGAPQRVQGVSGAQIPVAANNQRRRGWEICH